MAFAPILELWRALALVVPLSPPPLSSSPPPALPPSMRSPSSLDPPVPPPTTSTFCVLNCERMDWMEPLAACLVEECARTERAVLRLTLVEWKRSAEHFSFPLLWVAGQKIPKRQQAPPNTVKRMIRMYIITFVPPAT